MLVATSFPPISRISDRDQVRQRAARDRRHRSSRDGGIFRARQELSGGLVRRESAQAFRPHVLDMFEPQDHPNDFPYPGGPPTPPYDNAGLDARVSDGRAVRSRARRFRWAVRESERPAEAASGKGERHGNGRLPPERCDQRHVRGDQPTARGRRGPLLDSGVQAGAVFGAAKPTTRALVDKLAAEQGLSVESVASQPSGGVMKLRKLTIGLADWYGGSMPSGWTRFLLEQFAFPFKVYFHPRSTRQLIAGRCRSFQRSDSADGRRSGRPRWRWGRRTREPVPPRRTFPPRTRSPGPLPPGTPSRS